MNNTLHHFILRIHLKLKAINIYKAASVLFIFYCMLYLIFSILAPLKEIRNITSTYGIEQNEKWNLAGANKMADSILERSAMLDARLLLSENDSIGMFVSLTDSLLNLEVQGVTIHQSKISSIAMSRFFSVMDNATLFNYLSTPFMIADYRSTIAKVPVVIRHAPKDTAEANQTSYAPPLPPDEYVRFTLQLDKSLKIIIEQEEKSVGRRKIASISDKCLDKLRMFAITSSDMFRLRIPVYHPYIRLKIPGDEARTIFRALPEHTSLALEL
jgi:hypothetical protein